MRSPDEVANLTADNGGTTCGADWPSDGRISPSKPRKPGGAAVASSGHVDGTEAHNRR